MIELLIVITIIGVLSTIILSSVSNSRARAYDSKVKQQLSGFRTAAEMYFTNQGRYNETVGVPISDCGAGMFNNVDAINGTPGLYIAEGNLPDFANPVCGSTDSDFAVKATLYSGNEYWCVDNRGASRAIQGTPTSGTFCQ